jgi:hypothetical protein
MAKQTITFEYDPSELFDVLAQVGDGGASLGPRIVGSMLVPGGFIEAVGLAFYGITEVERTPTGETHG